MSEYVYYSEKFDQFIVDPVKAEYIPVFNYCMPFEVDLDAIYIGEL